MTLYHLYVMMKIKSIIASITKGYFQSIYNLLSCQFANKILKNIIKNEHIGVNFILMTSYIVFFYVYTKV